MRMAGLFFRQRFRAVPILARGIDKVPTADLEIPVAEEVVAADAPFHFGEKCGGG